MISTVWWHLPLGPVTKSTRERVQILLTDKTETLKLGIHLEPILPKGSRKEDTSGPSLTYIQVKVNSSKTYVGPYPYSLAPGK